MNLKSFLTGMIRKSMFRSLARRETAVCFMFHRIGEADNQLVGPNSEHMLHPRPFREVMQNLVQHFQPISLTELLDQIGTQERLPRNAVVITFDDGYLDTFECAVPILRDLQIPATIYVTSGFIDRTHYPYEFALAKWLTLQDRIELNYQGRELRWELRNVASAQECYRQIRIIIRKGSRRQQDAFMRKLLGGAPIDSFIEPDLFMRWRHVRELSRMSDITIGAHTISHPRLTQLSRKSATHEIQKSKAVLEKQLNESIQHFSYPYGSFNPTIKRSVKKAGYASAVTTIPQAIVRAQDPWAIPRIEVEDHTFTDASDLSGLLHSAR